MNSSRLIEQDRDLCLAYMVVSCRDNDMTKQGRRMISNYTWNLIDASKDMNEG